MGDTIAFLPRICGPVSVFPKQPIEVVVVMQRIVIADTQTIFRRGAVRILSAEEQFEVAAECSGEGELHDAIAGTQGAIVVFPLAMATDVLDTLARVEQTGGRSIVIVERGVKADRALSRRVACVLPRAAAGSQLLPCVLRVAAGERFVAGERLSAAGELDQAGVRMLQQLTPRELQILALVVNGAKNRDVAAQLGVKEQVVKNYLRSIYDKTGVSDRLELAVFVTHHRALSEAADGAKQELPPQK